MPPLSRAARQLLKDLQLAGLSHVPRSEVPVAPVMEPAAVESAPSVSGIHSSGSEPVRMSRANFLKQENPPKPVPASPVPAKPVAVRQPTTAPNLVVNTATLAEREEALKVLAQCVADCRRCILLATTRTQTVFGVGNAQAKVMFVGEAPGADEDKTGIPFVGKAGQLLTKIIEACGWTRDDIYICNILRCRPPENRTPNDTEAANCREYLDKQIATVDPEYIVCWGSCAAQNLLGTKEPIGRMRQRFYQYGRAKVLCTYHPSYLLRNPAAKKPVWEDMKLLLAEMGQTPPTP